MAIIANIIPAKFRTVINAFGMNIATTIGGKIAVDTVANLIVFLLFVNRANSFSNVSSSDVPTPMTDVNIAKNDIAQMNFCRKILFVMLVKTLINWPISILPRSIFSKLAWSEL
ncbi:hypothetical protein FACS1894113_1050 [Alphaproteobacteria bacterium]|nr:hypothetical protein FACS1894113_1050 [Alphaproteobacteria bacterium]